MSAKSVAASETTVVTGPVVMGRAYLYEPYQFKTDKSKDKESDKESDKDAGSPKFRVNLALDKERQSKLIDRLVAAQDRAMDAENWKKTTRARASLAFVDADEAEVPKEKDSAEMILLSEKRPQLAGHYSMSAKAPENHRPYVRYIDPDDGLCKDLPTPILDPDPDDPEEMAESERIRRLWDSMVYEGQNVSLSITFKAYVVGSNIGVSARLNGVIILGGGVRVGDRTFEEDYSPEDLARLVEWVKMNVGGDSGDVEDVDSETGEVGKKPRSSRRSKKPVEVDDDEEDVPAPRSSRRSKKPVEVDDEDDDDEDVDLY